MTDLDPTAGPADGELTPTAVERFLTATSKREPKHTIDDEEYVTMLWRMVRAFERRSIDNPEMLTQAVALAQRLAEVVNVTIAANAERYAVDARRGASMAECGRILGISKQSASERRNRGKTVLLARTAAAGAIRFAEARRERDAITAAAQHAVTSLAEWRARRSA